VSGLSIASCSGQLLALLRLFDALLRAETRLPRVTLSRFSGVARYRCEACASEMYDLTDDQMEKRGQLIRQLEEALALAEDLKDGATTYLIERALDEARAQQFRPPSQ